MDRRLSRSLDRGLSRSMPVLIPTFYLSPFTYRAYSPRWPERSPRRHFYVGGVRTQLIGADSYPNPSGSQRRLILCGAAGSYQKMTRSSSTAELSRTGVYCSREDLRPKGSARRATSCEDVFRGTVTTTTTAATTAWDSRLSESGVSLNDSRTDLGSSCVGLEDVDGASQCSFGSSSAFHEITGDSELDRPDSDCLSVPGSGCGYDRIRDGAGHERRRERSSGGGGGARKSRHDSGSREKFLAELTASSGRSSPSRGEDREFYHSTPTKRGSPVLAIFPADEEDLHFPSNDSFQPLNHSSTDSLLSSPGLPAAAAESFSPVSPQDKERARATATSGQAMGSSEDTVKEALRRRRRQFFSSLQDCSKLEDEQSAGETVQSWLRTGHPQRHDVMTPLAIQVDDEDASYLPDQPQPQRLSPPSTGGTMSVRDRVRAIEQQGSAESSTQISGQPDSQRGGNVSTSTLCEKIGGGAQHPYPPSQTAPALNNRVPGALLRGAGDENSDCSTELTHAQSELSVTTRKAGVDEDKKQPPSYSSSPLSGKTLSDTKQLAAAEGNLRSGGSGEGKAQANTCGSRWNNDAGGGGGGSVAETLAAGQAPGANYRAVSAGDDARANTGAAAAASANTDQSGLRSSGGGGSGSRGASDDVYQNELSSVADIETGATTSPSAISDQDREFARLISEISETDSSIAGGSLKSDAVGKEGGRGSENGQSASLYHARPIRIASPEDDREQQTTDRVCDHATGNPSSTFCRSSVTGDSPTSPSLHPNDSTLSASLVYRSDALPDCDDAEVQSLTQRVNVNTTQQQSSAPFGEWSQQDEPATTDMGQSSDRHAAMDPNATVQEISSRHSRHVHRTRTTVEETVTTRHTLRHPAGSAGSSERVGGKAHATTSPWLGQGLGGDYEVTDETVSRVTVTEEDSEREETVTRNVAGPQPESGRCSTVSTSYQSPVKSTATKQNVRTSEENYHLLDSLQEKLSLLSSDGTSFDPRASSAQTQRPPFGYKDRAEASLPQTTPTESDSVQSHSNVVRGTGSVFFTLDRSGATGISGTESSGLTGNSAKAEGVPSYGSETSEPGHDTLLSRAQDRGNLLTSTGEIWRRRETTDYPGLSSTPKQQHHSPWSLTGSSSEINDSDDRCTPVSITDGSSHLQPYSDVESESRAEEGTSVQTFQDFLSGLQGQFTSDQPSRHRSVDMMADDYPPYLLRSPFIQETILEADDERESTDEDVAPSPAIDSFKSSLHFCMPQSDPSSVLSVSPQMRQQSKDVDIAKISASPEDKVQGPSPEHLLQDLSDKLSSLRDESFELHADHDSFHHDGPELSTTERTSPTIREGSLYHTSASAEVQKVPEQHAQPKQAEPTQTSKQTSRRSSATRPGPKKAQWVQEKLLLFQKLLNDFESQSKTSEQKLLEDMMATDSRKGGEGSAALEKQQSDNYDDLYRQFTREHLERRQSHVCPVVEDHLPTFRFRRFLRKKHNSKLKKGRKTFRVRHQLQGLSETPQAVEGGQQQPLGEVAPPAKTAQSEAALAKTRQPPYHLHHHAHRILSPGKLRGRVISEVFTDDADVNRSVSSDSAYSSLSAASSRNISDLDSTFRSVTGSRADVSSLSLDVSMDGGEKVRSFSDVFDHPELYVGDVDEARLDRLQVGHTKAETL